MGEYISEPHQRVELLLNRHINNVLNYALKNMCDTIKKNNGIDVGYQLIVLDEIGEKDVLWHGFKNSLEDDSRTIGLLEYLIEEVKEDIENEQNEQAEKANREA